MCAVLILQIFKQKMKEKKKNKPRRKVTVGLQPRMVPPVAAMGLGRSIRLHHSSDRRRGP